MDRYQVLSKICLNNWHYINEKLLSFHDEINFFTGHSGSGKSTVLDAMQIVLYADSNGRGFFNKAAKEDSDRTLLEYLRGMKVVQENNEASYLRNKNFSTTIVLEFQDTESKKYQSLGVVFDVDVSVNEINRLFFWHGGELAENHYRDGEKVLSINELKDYIQNHYPKEEYFFSRTNEKFRNELYSTYFGGLHPKHFPALFKKAIPFKMDMKLEDFVKNYICTETDIHMEDMQDSVAQYTRLKRKLEDTKKEIQFLTELKEQYNHYEDYGNQIKQYQYNLDKMDISSLETNLQFLKNRQTQYQEDIKKLQQSITALEESIAKLQKQRDEVAFAIQNSGYEHLEAELVNLNQLLELLYGSKAVYDKMANGLGPWMDLDLLDQVTKDSIVHMQEYHVTQNEIEKVKGTLADIKVDLETNKETLTSKRNELRIKISDINKQLTTLKSGHKAYPEYLLEVKNYITRELEQEYETPVRVDILADMVEIKDEQWLNAVEGYLGNHKLNLMVPPQYAKHAIELYQRLDPKKYYKAAVIDTERVIHNTRPILPGSLAEEVECASDYAKAYIHYLMGAVIKCGSLEELRNLNEHRNKEKLCSDEKLRSEDKLHSDENLCSEEKLHSDEKLRSEEKIYNEEKYHNESFLHINKSGITSDCVLYQGYKIQHINPRNYTEEAYIGRSAIERRITQLEQNLKDLQIQKEPVEEQLKQIGEILQFEYLQNDIDFYITKLQEIRQIKQKEQQKDEYIRKITELKQQNIDEWRVKKSLIEEAIHRKSLQKEKDRVSLQTKEAEIKGFQDSILSLNEELLNKKNSYCYDEQREEAFRMFMKGQENRRMDSIRNDLLYNKQNCENQMGAEYDKLVKKREQYHTFYSYRGFSLTCKNNNDYDQLLEHLSSDKLNEFTTKASEQAVLAIYHFKTDFIYKIRDSIKEVMQQKEDLNRILSQLDFGKDKYKFIITRNKGEDGKFYDMFMDENLEINPHQLTGSMNNQMDFFSMQHEKDYSELINELIELFMPPENCDSKTLEEARMNMEKYSDYRTYLSFDMEQLVEGMPPMRLSRMLSKNSGGEGQNPLYVALLASFAQVYRINLKSNIRRRPTPRLVVLDEAFSKMDAEKVGSCIGLIRKLGFQAIISATNDKIQNYVDNVDKTFVFANPNKNRISIQEFEKKEFIELLTSQEGEEDDIG